MRIIHVFMAGCLALCTAGFAGESVWLSSLDITKTVQGYGHPHADKSVNGNPISIGGTQFARGLGTHADSLLCVKLDGKGMNFTAQVGLDDEERNPQASIAFKVMADGRELWTSGIMRSGHSPKPVDVDLRGVKVLVLMVTDGGDGINYDHADWADAQIVMNEGTPETLNVPREEPVILTPKPGPAPRITGAKVYGCRPGNPFLFRIPATGDRPMTYSVRKLPKGLTLDPQTGIITGAVAKRGDYHVTLVAKNALGKAQRKFKIVCGDQISLTPAMGWNSWNCFAHAISEDKVKAAAAAMVKSGLVNHGWTYINIDDFWEKHRDSHDPTLGGAGRDAAGRIVPNPRFPDMKGLCDYIHSLGLKAGLYSSPGPWTCGGCVASFDHERLDAQSYGEWGFDYLKYDWCSYNAGLESKRGQAVDLSHIRNWGGVTPKANEQLMHPYAVMRSALDTVPRDIVYSLCQYGMGDVWEWGDKVGGNSWRTTGDITDNWGSLSHIGFNQAGHETFAKPGNWNDPDMLIVGMVGWGPALHPTRLTPNEQYTHISLWCLLCSPLLIGCDMTQLDDFTLGLLTNDEVLEVNQDPLGRQAGRVAKSGNLEIWAKDMENGSKAVGLFNRGELETSVTVKWADLGLAGKQTVRDLWRQKDLGGFEGEFSAPVPRHGVVLVRLTSVAR